MKSIDELGISSAPWSVDDWGDETNLDVRIRDANEDEIAQPFASYADARLVAAAPELYNALCRMLDLFRHTFDERSETEKVTYSVMIRNAITESERAIAKAAGGLISEELREVQDRR